MLVIFFFLLAILVASALCSVAEAAILSLPFIRARILEEQGHGNAKALLYVKENLALAISSLVIVNNAINISGSIFIGQMVTRRLGDGWLGIVSALLTFIIIIFGEIIPKTLGERYKIPVSLFAARPLKILMFVFKPLVMGLMRMTESLVKVPKYPRVTEDEIRIMLKLGRDAGTVGVDEEVLCNRVFKLNDVRAHQIMRPLQMAYSVPSTNMLRDVKDAVVDSPYSRILVYENNPLEIVGVVQRSALLVEITKGHDYALVKDFMIRPIFVADTTPVDTLLSMFQKYHQHLFIVQDPLGRDIGLVTMEDALEELFGEIYDEKDLEVRAMRSPKAKYLRKEAEKK